MANDKESEFIKHALASSEGFDDRGSRSEIPKDLKDRARWEIDMFERPGVSTSKALLDRVEELEAQLQKAREVGLAEALTTLLDVGERASHEHLMNTIRANRDHYAKKAEEVSNAH